MVSFQDLDIIGYFLLFLVGIVAAATMIIPGISGSFILMLIGYYEPIINTIRDLSHMIQIKENIMILLPFGLGILIGIVGIAKLIEYLLHKYEIKTYYGIIGFVLSSLISILIQMGMPNNGVQFMIGILLAFLGFFFAYRLGRE